MPDTQSVATPPRRPCCLETRKTTAGWTRRRYLMGDGSRLTTYEVPESVLRRFSMPRVEQVMAQWERGRQARARAAEIRAHILAHPDVKGEALALELGIGKTRVYTIRREARENKT